MNTVIYKEEKNISTDELLDLYNDAGWKAYTSDPEKLAQAVSNSLYVLTARDGGKLVGLLRAIGDGLTIIYIQDILVLNGYRRQGTGSRLLKMTLDKYSSVRQIVLLTDNTPETVLFYEKAGFKNVETLGLSSFIKHSS
jgi:ribosomal protein S18 acetylase RimI-like enzyme